MDESDTEGFIGDAEPRKPGRPKKKTEVDIQSLIKEKGITETAKELIKFGIPKTEVSQKLGIDMKLMEDWEKFMGKDEDEEEDEARPAPATSSESTRDTWSLDRMQSILKNTGMRREDLAADLVRADAQIRRLEDIIAGKNNTRGDGGAEMGDTMFGQDDVKFLQEMYRFQMKMMMSKKMMKSMNMGGDDGEDNKYNKLLLERLDRLEKKDEMERTLGPIRQQLEAMTKRGGEDINPAFKAQIDALKDTITKYDMDKKQHDMLSEFTKAASKGEDPLKYMKDMEEMRSKYDSANRQMELEVQRQRDENFRNVLERAFGEMQRKIEDIERKGTGQGGLSDIKNIGETIKTLREINSEIGGTPVEKPSLADRVIESTVANLGASVPKFLDVYKEMKRNNPSPPPRQDNPEYQEIVLSPEEMDGLMRNRQAKKKSPPNPLPQLKSEPVMPTQQKFEPVRDPMIELVSPSPMAHKEVVPDVETNKSYNFEVKTEEEPYSSPNIFLPEDTNYNQIKQTKNKPEPVDIKPEPPVVNEPEKRRGRPKREKLEPVADTTVIAG